MLLRPAGDAVLVIGQPAHAWVSGQIARAWGNARFGSVEPWEEVCLAAEQHDTGMAGWDLAPTLNSDTGRPHSFMELPLSTHLRLWSEGPRSVLTQSRYAAVLVSMHGAGLYERRDLAASPASEASAVRAFLADQRAFQDELLGGLRADPTLAGAAAEAVVARNSRLIWVWDALSLAVLLGWAPYRTDEAPTAGGHAALELAPVPDAPGRLWLDPWPFAAGTLSLRCEGRRLEGRFGDEEQMRAALARAPWETLDLTLAPRPEG